MPQLDGKGSPRGAVTGVERGGEVERVVIARRTAVLACARVEQRVLCSLVFKSSLVVIISVTCIIKLDRNTVRSHIDCSYSYI